MHLKSVDYSKCSTIVDMGLLWQLSTPYLANREKDDGTFYIWKDYGVKDFDTIPWRHPSGSMIIAVNDYYKNYVVNVKGGVCQKCSAIYVVDQMKNVFPAKEIHFPV